jgi:Tol biopolymer transport system component
VGHAALSPDGQRIAFVSPGPPYNRIRMVDLHGASEGEITVSGAGYLTSLEWSADGTGFFSEEANPTGDRLLYIERTGTSHVLWTQSASGFRLWGSPSPNGRYLATLKYKESANVWMFENP